MSESATEVPDPRVLEETLAEGRRVLEISMTRFDQEFRRTEHIQALAIGMLATTMALLSIPHQANESLNRTFPQALFLSAVTVNLAGAIVLVRALSGSRRRVISYGPDLGRFEMMLEDPGWDLTTFSIGLIRVVNRDVRLNMEEERTLLFGRTRGLLLLYTSATMHLLNLFFYRGRCLPCLRWEPTVSPTPRTPSLAA